MAEMLLLAAKSKQLCAGRKLLLAGNIDERDLL
jgi:hypothetical protein